MRMNEKTFLKGKILELPKMKTLKEAIDEHPKSKMHDIVSLMPKGFFDGKKQSSQIIYASKAVTWIKN